MALVINRAPRDPSPMIADRALYLDATQTVIVEEGDPRSAYQFTGKGREIDAADAVRLGLTVVDGKVRQGVEPEASVAPEPANDNATDDAKGEPDAPKSSRAKK